MDYTMDDVKRLIHSKSWALYKQLKASGCHSYSREDLEQELWLAYCRARDSFSEQFGVPFMAYLATGLKQQAHHIRNHKVFNRIEEEWATSLSTPLGDEDGGATFGDVLPSANPLQSAGVEESSNMAFAMRHLSKRARIFVKILSEQPIELLEAIKQAEARIEQARALGVKHMHYSQVTSGAIFKVMGASRLERTKILDEVRKVGKMLEDA
jgi:DNA-directed RNA polymerase specialized sigma24 family protein